VKGEGWSVKGGGEEVRERGEVRGGGGRGEGKEKERRGGVKRGVEEVGGG
jgi:hypothetical protein